jgi:hypothetical protein
MKLKPVFIVMILLVLLTACVRQKAPSSQGNWDSSTWDSVSWQ